MKSTTLLGACFVVSLVSVAMANETEGLRPLTTELRSIIASRCLDCHGADSAEGNVRLDNLEAITLPAQLDLLNRVYDQLFFNLMPPGNDPQSRDQEHSLLSQWIRQELLRLNASKFDDKLRYPGNGNLVDHELLFSGRVQDKAYSPARRWLVSPQIFHQRVIDVFEMDERDRKLYSHSKKKFYGVTNPFLLPERSGVRYFDLDSLDGGHLLVLLDNAKWIAEKQIHAARVKNQELKPGEFVNGKDRWAPNTTPRQFEEIILGDNVPTDTSINAAIEAQFRLVLGRQPSPDEFASYLSLTRDAIEVGGTTNGLRQMLIAVLLESEFYYRQEFGAGKPDVHGRFMLSPREASYAIAYAIGDRGPDEQLKLAAEQGRLNTRQDFRREVTRLLNDDTYFRGQIDPALNGSHYQSNETSHPRLVRFFREFFGYPLALRVFKDSSRSEGRYANPKRGTLGTPGWLVVEADRIVTRHVENDRDVFENLLTFDEFYVYHDKDNATGRKVIDQWRSVYERLKNTPWQTSPEEVLEANLEFLKSVPAMQIKDTSRPGELVNFMHYFEESFGQGRTPFTTVPWAHGYTFHHAPFYNLPPTPRINRYGSWRSTKYIADLEPVTFWDYPTDQPFPIDHRKGILTHPAWLIAHSSNFHTDPIRRGRWIREKLLAGRVPDVPITVDAQLPDDAHRTLRQRVDSVTTDSQCWKCHRQMNPLGYPFEIYDDFGRFRKEEPLESPEHLLQSGNGKTSFNVYETGPIDARGELSGTNDPALDGEVSDALEMIDRLAQSQQVRQSIIRHAFRFFMGRNEMLSDSQTLIDADQAYVQSGGSFKAVVLSLLTSDSFLYRKSHL